MDSLHPFMREIYIVKPDSRLTVKDIYEDFRAWVICKYGTSAWNNISQRQVYAALKDMPGYAYVRYREGYCLKGISYKQSRESIISVKEVNIMPSLDLPKEALFRQDVNPVLNLPNTSQKEMITHDITKDNIIKDHIMPDTNIIPHEKGSISSGQRQNILVIGSDTRTVTSEDTIQLPMTMNVIPVSSIFELDKMMIKQVAPRIPTVRVPSIGQTKTR